VNFAIFSRPFAAPHGLTRNAQRALTSAPGLLPIPLKSKSLPTCDGRVLCFFALLRASLVYDYVGALYSSSRVFLLATITALVAVWGLYRDRKR
jgi:hypothetical protein